MIRVIIIEDELPALQEISRILNEVDSDIQVLKNIRSVNEGIAYFQKTSSVADIIFSDVQLTDGLSFEIFRKTSVNIPVIFTTGYDKFMMLAFENNGIDYILKPVEEKDIRNALWKYQSLQNHFKQDDREATISRLVHFIGNRTKSRLLVKRGTEHILLRLVDIVLFFTENKVVFVMDRSSRKFILDKTLTELEQELDPQLFFRANRKYIINLNFIKGYKTFEKVKLMVDFNVPEIKHAIVVSQETAQSFRQWMREA